MGGSRLRRAARALVWALGPTMLLAVSATPSYASWKRVLAHRSKTHPYFACANHRRARCHLIADPTRGSRRSGPVHAGAITAGPELEASPALHGSGVEGGYSPEDIRKAYKLPSASAGAGETVAVVDAFDDPNAEADLKAYRAHYGISECTSASGCFRKVNQSGGVSNPAPSVGWSEEISLDLDMVSAVCPNCHILLVEANSPQSADLAAAVNEAVTLGATEISNSYGSPVGEEAPFVSAYDHPGIPITVAAGDEGYAVEVPADNPHVIAVGGTTLVPEAVSKANPRGWKETVWFDEEAGEISGTGSGCSSEPKPSWQKDPGCAGRTNNDIAVVGDQNTPVSTYDSYKTEATWNLEGGTSVGAPIVAAAMALTNSYTRSFDGAHALYVDSLLNKGAFNDVTEGTNGACTPPPSHAYFCTAEVGYDGPTGLGTLAGAPEAPQPVLETKAATGVNAGEATLNATIDPNDVTFTKCRFEYGLTTKYGSSVTAACPPESPESGLTPVAVSAHLSGLTAATTYHYRVTASYQGQGSSGGDSTFTTVGAAPTVTTEPASAVGANTVTLNAKVDPNGSVTSCHFEYGISPSFGETAPCGSSPGAGQSFVAVSASIPNLKPDTSYHFRIVAVNAFGERTGSELTFKTGLVLPTVAPKAATELSPTEARLNGSVNPGGVEVTECTFEYGGSTTYGASVPCAPEPGKGESATAVSAAIAELLPGRTYHFRVVASNANGVSRSADESFTTPAEAPVALTESGVADGTSSATLSGVVLPNGGAISGCRFEYGTSSAGILEASAPCTPAPTGSEEGAPVSATVTGLAAGTTYHYRLVASNSAGSSYGVTLTFTTGAATLGGGGPLEEITGGHGQPGPGLPTLASRRLSASASGHLAVSVRCSAGSSACAGTISLRAVTTLGASSRKRRHATRHAVLLASGPFKVDGGRVTTIRLRLSHTARALLRRSHLLHASATIIPAAGKTARTTVTIHSH